MLCRVGGGIIFEDLAILACQKPTGFVGISRLNMCHHLLVHVAGDTHYKGFKGYHKIFASKISSSSSSSRVHKSSLRYFQPPSARMTTILPRSKLSAARNAACRAAPHDG